MVRISSYEQFELLRDLAQHQGAVFVRLPNGCAYEARVNVPSISERPTSPVVEVQLTTEQIDLTDDFRAQAQAEEGEG